MGSVVSEDVKLRILHLDYSECGGGGGDKGWKEWPMNSFTNVYF